MADIAVLADALAQLGFTDHPEHPQHDLVDELSHNGPYTVLGSWVKGDTIVHVEQNVAPEVFEVPDGDGGTQKVTVPAFHFPPVVVIKNTVSGGSYSVSLDDMDAFGRLIAGDTDFNEND